jgi:hypothetical protein
LRSARGVGAGAAGDLARLGALGLHDLGDLDREAVHVVGLLDEGLGAVLERPLLVGLEGLARHDDRLDRGGLGIALEPVEQSEPVEAGHEDVEDEQLRLLGLDDGLGLEAVLDEQGAVAGVLEELEREPSDDGVVVHDDDLSGHGGRIL